MTELAPNCNFCIMTDSDEFMVLELQEANSESEQLKLSYNDISVKLDKTYKEIIHHASKWTTSEHRRNALFPCYFHVTDLPIDIEKYIRPLNDFTNKILEELPQPKSHIRHFQWLPAVKNYVNSMQKSKLQLPNLLDDERNFLKETKVSKNSKLDLLMSNFKRLNKYINFRLAYKINEYYFCKLLRQIITKEIPTLDIVNIAGSPIEPINIYPSQIFKADYSNVLNLNAFFIDIALNRPNNKENQLLITGPLGVMNQWPTLEEDLVTLSKKYSLIIIALVHTDFRPINIEQHSYILASILRATRKSNFNVSSHIFKANSTSEEDVYPLNIVRTFFFQLHQKATNLFSQMKLVRPDNEALLSGLVFSIKVNNN
jgi:hypothetical protein